MNINDITPEEVSTYYKKLEKNATHSGYFLNPDKEFVNELIKGLIINRKRYGYASCPCRLATDTKVQDLDIICPCDYRDQDINEFGACFCALYVSQEVAKGKAKARSIPDRRVLISDSIDQQARPTPILAQGKTAKYPVWRCKVCGYLCARDSAPEVCPICKATKERFEEFVF